MVPLPGVHLGEVVLPLWGQKSQRREPLELPYLLTREQRHLPRAANMDTGFLLCFTTNSKLQHVHMTVLLGKTSTGYREARPPKDRAGLSHTESLIFGVLRMSWWA